MGYRFRRGRKGRQASIAKEFAREHPNLVVARVKTVKRGVRPKNMRLYRIHYRKRRR